MARSFDVIVLGVGGVGSSTCAHLAKRGLKVLGLEQYPLVHARGSSHGETRIIRKAYFEHPDYVPLLRRAYDLWRELEQDVQLPLYRETGLLLAGPATGETITGARLAAQLHNIPLETSSPATIRERFPGIELPDEHVALFETEAGFLAVEACVAAHIERARQLGADIRAETDAKLIEIGPRDVTVRTEQDLFTAAKLVVTAGAWTSRLLPSLSPLLKPSRKFLGWFQVEQGAYHVDRGYPCYFVEQPHGTFYGFPSLEGQSLKLAEHSGFEGVDNPALVDRSCRPDDLTRLVEFQRQIFPQSTGRLVQHTVCLYTMSPDSHFIIDRLPEAPHVVVGCGFSGHGFKFTSVLGEVLTQMAVDGRSALPVDFLSLSRFGTGRS